PHRRGAARHGRSRREQARRCRHHARSTRAEPSRGTHRHENPMTHRVALLLSTLLLGVGPVSAQQGITSLGPDWSPEPKTYATTAALFADSLAVSWDGTKAVEVRLRVA